MPLELKPLYLVHGDDHGAIAERRAGLHALAEKHGDAASVEQLEGEAASPAAVAMALATMTFAIGRRVILVEGVERWKEADVKEVLAGAIADMPPDTTLALFAREEGRSKAPAILHEAVKRAGGQVVAQITVKPWELPKWVREQAARLGLTIDLSAAKALVAQVGERQQRLLRELEKLALELESPGGHAQVGIEEIEQRAAHSSSRRAFTLADSLVAGNRAEATRSYLQLREQGERISGLTYLMAQRMRDALEVSLKLQAGESAADVKRGLRMPPRAAERFVADVSRSDPEHLKAALGTLADLELDSRGGSLVSAWRSTVASMSEETLALRAIATIGELQAGA